MNMISEMLNWILVTVLQVIVFVFIYLLDQKKLKRLEECVLMDNQCFECDNLISDKNGCYCMLMDGGSYDDDGRCRNFVRKDCDDETS